MVHIANSGHAIGRYETSAFAPPTVFKRRQLKLPKVIYRYEDAKEH